MTNLFTFAIKIIYIMNNIGNKIRNLREQKGYSQESLAQELGLTQPSYARLEKQDERLSITRLMQIATILKTTVAELIDEKTQKVSHQNNNDTANSYNADTINTIINANKEHIATLKEEIVFLRNLLNNK
jgi:transcriptional regulator with XRE-family HTH domain